MTGGRVSPWSVVLVAAAGAPALLAVCMETMTLVQAAAGSHPGWPDLRLNLSEATAVRDTAEVVRLLDDGADPNARYAVRPGLVDNSEPVNVTPLEAAISIRRAELVSLLLKRGVRVSDADWTRLRCVAREYEDEDLEAALDTSGGAADPHCSGEETLW